MIFFAQGDVAERLGRGLQNLLQRFKSARLLISYNLKYHFDISFHARSPLPFMATTADLRKGAVIKFNNDPCLILESEHRTPGNLRAFYQVRMRNLRSGKVAETRFRSGESLDFLRVEKKDFQFLYKDGNDFVFMDKESYEQINVEPKSVGDYARFLKEGADTFITFNESDILAVEMPAHVQLRVTETEPGVKGDSVNNIMKPATLETGAEIQVPIFVNEGDMIRIDTSNGAYMERVKE
jgi:elongation factor P